MSLGMGNGLIPHVTYTGRSFPSIKTALPGLYTVRRYEPFHFPLLNTQITYTCALTKLNTWYIVRPTPP